MFLPEEMNTMNLYSFPEKQAFINTDFSISRSNVTVCSFSSCSVSLVWLHAGATVSMMLLNSVPALNCVDSATQHALLSEPALQARSKSRSISIFRDETN